MALPKLPKLVFTPAPQANSVDAQAVPSSISLGLNRDVPFAPFSSGATQQTVNPAAPSTLGLIGQVFKGLAPQTANLVKKADTPGKQLLAGAAILPGLAQEAIIQPANKLVFGLGNEVLSGGAPQAFTPKTALEKIALGSKPVEPLSKELPKLPALGYKLAGELPTVKAAGNDWTSKVAQFSAALPLGLVSGGLEALNITGFEPEGQLAKGVVNATAEGVGKKLIRDAMETTIRDAMKATGREIVDEDLLRQGLDQMAEHAMSQKSIAEKMDVAKTNTQKILDAISEQAPKEIPETPKTLPTDQFWWMKPKEEPIRPELPISSGQRLALPEGNKPSIQQEEGLLQRLEGSQALPEPSPQGYPIQETGMAQQQSLLQSEGSNNVPSMEELVARYTPDVNQKVNVIDYLRTPQHVLEKIGLGDEAKLLKQKYDDYLRELPIEINKITEWSKRASEPGASQRIFQYLDGQPIELHGEEKVVADEIKPYLKEWAVKLKLPSDNQITHYITHIFDKELIQKEFDPDLARLIEGRVPGSVYDPFLQKRLGALGYKQDAWAALDAYVKRGVRKYNMDVALEKLQKASMNLDIDSFKYVERLAARINMRPTELDNLIDNLIKSSPVGYKFGARPLSFLSKKIRQMVFRGTLGLNVGSALRNLTQGVNTFAELGTRYTLRGYSDLLKNMAKGSTELVDSGVLRDEFIQDRTLSATKKFWEKTDKGLFALFEAAEKINRGSAYYGMKAKMLDSGASEKDAVQAALGAVEKTQFRFGSVDTPVALQSDVAKLLLQFQSFNVKQAEFLAGKVTAKEWAGLVRYVLASIFMVATAGKLIGVNYSDFIPFSGIATGKTKIGVTPPVNLISEILKALTNAPDKYGKPQTFGQKLQNIGSAAIPFFPAGSQIKKTYQSIQNIQKGRIKGTGDETKALLFGKYLPKAKSSGGGGGMLKAKMPKLPKLPKLKTPKI